MDNFKIIYKILKALEKSMDNEVFDVSSISHEVLAGNGSYTELRSKQMLSDKFGGDVDKWSKKVGKIESDKYVFDIHWNEYEGKQYIIKIKNRKEKKI